jgi:hypothetical protein
MNIFTPIRVGQCLPGWRVSTHSFENPWFNLLALLVFLKKRAKSLLAIGLSVQYSHGNTELIHDARLSDGV